MIAAPKSWTWPDYFSNHSTKIWNHKIATGAWRFMSPHLQQFCHNKNTVNLRIFDKLWAQTSARAPRPQATLHCLGEQPEPCPTNGRYKTGTTRASKNECIFCVVVFIQNLPKNAVSIFTYTILIILNMYIPFLICIYIYIHTYILLFHVYFLNRNPPCACTDFQISRPPQMPPSRRSSTADASA